MIIDRTSPYFKDIDSSEKQGKLLDYLSLLQKDEKGMVVGAICDGLFCDLQAPSDDFKLLKPLTMTDAFGLRIYRRSVYFLMATALSHIDKNAKLRMLFSANGGLYCAIDEASVPVDEKLISSIENLMNEYIKQALPIEYSLVSTQDAIEYTKKMGYPDLINTISRQKTETIGLYRLDGHEAYMFEAMLWNTKYLNHFKLKNVEQGVLLLTPRDESMEVPVPVDHPRLTQALIYSKEWANLLNCKYVSDLNEYIKEGRIGDLIRVSEALHEKNIAQIADNIVSDKNKRLILIAGPSCSGKTSFAQRLRVQLLVNGVQPVTISMDDYFVERYYTPRNEKGEYDFDSIKALDTKLFNEQLERILKGERVVLPKYNFLNGLREWDDNNFIQVSPDQPILIEGIHGLNEDLTRYIPSKYKYKIFVSALIQLNIDAHNRIPTTISRLVRRLVRDYRTRGHSPISTFQQWNSVLQGEQKNIYPYQENADVFFNSALIYEQAMLHKHLVSLLASVPPESPHYPLSSKLLEFADCFESVQNDDLVPNNSILREFIGKSVFFPTE